MEFPYSRQINRPIRHLRFFTWQDLLGMAVCFIVVPQIFGLGVTLGILLGWFVENLLFRVGRPAGYRRHFFKSLFRPEHFNAGRGIYRRMVIRNTQTNV